MSHAVAMRVGCCRALSVFPVALMASALALWPAAAGADPCVVVDDGSGTAVLPPPGCGYVSPDEFHEIDISGLPPGTKIIVKAEHDRFLCCEEPGAQCSPDPNFCGSPGGSFPGGEVEYFQSTLTLKMTGTGELEGFHRTIPMNVFCETHTGPRTLGDPVQTFPTDMFQLQGQLFGDPDFAQLQVIGGTGFGMPSPGHTTLTQLGPPGSNWTVDSFFDITYRIEFQGAPGGALDGLSGATAPGTAIHMEAQGPPVCVPPGQDCWSTACDGGTEADFSADPIPADFFDPGSDPFTGRIELGGAMPSGIDTRVQRLGQLCFYDPPWTDTVPIELVELNLVSCQPITVEGSGLWDVQVGLSPVSPGPGSMTVTKTHPGGGTFESSFPVQPLYIFSRVGNPSDIRVLDTGAIGIPPIVLATNAPTPWLHEEAFEQCTFDGFAPGATTSPQGDPCCVETCHSSMGQADHEHCTSPPGCPECPDTEACCLLDGGCFDSPVGGCDGIGQGPGTSCATEGAVCQDDCNTNGLPDVADLAFGLSKDLNENRIPDECEAPCCDPASSRNGDWDGDCDVDMLDFAAIQICFGRHVGSSACKTDGCGFMDLDQDGFITDNDVLLFTQTLDASGPDAALPGCDTDAGSCDAWATGPPTDPGLEFGGTYYVFGDPPPPVPTGYDFNSNGNPPIPADFFGPGSLPFEGVVPLGGQPQKLKTMGTTDTLVEHPPLRFGFGDLPQCDTVPVRLESLSLRSIDPIVVHLTPNPSDCNANGQDDALDILNGLSVDTNTNGVPDECEWYLAAELSMVDPSDGVMHACKTHDNGGTFDVTIHVQPLFVFVRKSDLDAGLAPTPDNVKMLDTGEQGLSPIAFMFTDVPFSVCSPQGEGIYVTPCSQGNFVPGLDTSPAPCVVCPDVNGDGFINKVDLTIWQSNFGCTTCPELDMDCDGVVTQADMDAAQASPCFGQPVADCPDCQGGARAAGLRQQTTCQSHITPGESHYFCPPRCIESLCTSAAVGPPLGFCFPLGCGPAACPNFPALFWPGSMCTALDPTTCPPFGFFRLGFGGCQAAGCFPFGVCVQFYGPPSSCTPTGRFTCP